MSIERLTVKSNYIIWRNIQLPHPSRNCKSPIFCIGELQWQFKITSTWMKSEEKFTISTEYEEASRSYSIMPYIETPEKYVRTRMDISRSSLIDYKIYSDKITILFFFESHSETKPLDFKETYLKEENNSGMESVQSLCLKGLSKDIVGLFNEKGYSDAILRCGEKSFAVHRNILVARSEVFFAMFKHDMSEKNSGIVNIDDLNPNVLEQFLRYLYSGYVEEMSMDTVLELYKAANKYAVLTLKKLCSSYIVDNLSENMICNVLLLADEAEDIDFLSNVASFAVKIEGFLKSAEWKDFSKKYPNIAVEVFFKYHN